MQEVIFGLSNLKTCLAKCNCHKFMLVCDSAYPYLDLDDFLRTLPYDYIRFSQFTPNPLYDDVCKGVNLFQEKNCDSIVALGGGSTIDVAKCIKLFCHMNSNELYLRQDYFDNLIPLIAVPTTAGTGSESTRFAVIYYEGKKQSITHPSIIPDFAVLEPKLLYSLPIYQKKCTLLDALCQGIESWWSINSTEESRTYSKIAVETIMRNWQAYIFDNSHCSATNMMEAANYAGRAICITQTTAPHAFSYKITSLFGLPHGHAVAICLPEIWQYMLTHYEDCIDPRGKLFLKKIFTNIADAMGTHNPNEAIALFRIILSKLEMSYPNSIHRVNDITLLTHSVNPDRLQNNPIKLDQSVIEQLYKLVIR